MASIAKSPSVPRTYLTPSLGFPQLSLFRGLAQALPDTGGRGTDGARLLVVVLTLLLDSARHQEGDYLIVLDAEDGGGWDSLKSSLRRQDSKGGSRRT